MYACMMTVAVMLSGCGGAAINKNHYVLDVTPKHTARLQQQPGAILEIRTFTIGSEFSGRQMVYRTGEVRYAPDYYNEFLIPPAMMITELTRTWLADTGLFTYVMQPGGAMMPGYVLEGDIVACYADIRDKAAPAAVLNIRVLYFKQDKGTNTLVWNHMYETREPMKNTQAESFAAATSRGLQTILQKLEVDVSE